MSVSCPPSLLTLPTEILHRILDRLDTKDILLSFRNVCVHFRAVTNVYNRYKIQVTTTSPEDDVRLLCRMIKPSSIISCALMRSDGRSDFPTSRIQLFLSLIDIHQLTRLHSLDLFYRDEFDFSELIRHVCCIPTFMSLSLRWTKSGSITNDTIDLLSSIVFIPSLRKLHLSRIHPRIFISPTTNPCRLESLTIDDCSHRQLSDVLHHLSDLRVFSSNYYFMDEMHPVVFSAPFQQLTSLTLRSPQILIDQLESLLSFTPSLVHLHIVSHSSTFRFLQHLSQWEHFIRDKLPLLKMFQFYAFTNEYQYTNVQDMELILNGFRTPFWIEEKHWYVTSKYTKNGIRSGMMLYSSTTSDGDFPNNLWPDILSYSTSTTKDDDITKTSSTWNARFNLSSIDEAISLHHMNPPTDRIFHRMTHLALDIDWPINSFDLLATLTDLSQLREIWLFLSGYHRFDWNMLYILFELASNVRTLAISYNDDSTFITEDIFSIISHQIEHLKVRTTNIDCMQLIIECAEHLSSITFIRDRASDTSWIEIIEWLIQRGNRFSQSDDHKSLQVWIDTIPNQQLQITTDH